MTHFAGVPIAQSLGMVEALRKHQKTYVWLELKGEGHGIEDEDKQKLFDNALFDFLDKYIGPDASVAAVRAANSNEPKH